MHPQPHPAQRDQQSQGHRGEDDRRYSNFSWRTRMALRHKRLEVRYRPILLTDKDAIKLAGSIQVVDAQHVSILLFVLGQYPVPDTFAKIDVAAKAPGSAAPMTGAVPDTK